MRDFPSSRAGLRGAHEAALNTSRAQSITRARGWIQRRIAGWVQDWVQGWVQGGCQVGAEENGSRMGAGEDPGGECTRQIQDWISGRLCHANSWVHGSLKHVQGRNQRWIQGGPWGGSTCGFYTRFRGWVCWIKCRVLQTRPSHEMYPEEDAGADSPFRAQRGSSGSLVKGKYESPLLVMFAM